MVRNDRKIEEMEQNYHNQLEERKLENPKTGDKDNRTNFRFRIFGILDFGFFMEKIKYYTYI
jgi:hypothetical protein